MKNLVDIKRNEEGQSLIETMLLLPFLFFVLLWLTQFFIAAQTSEIAQERTRNELFTQIDNWRDLRDLERGVAGVGAGVAIDDPAKNYGKHYNQKQSLVFKTEAGTLKREFGPQSGSGMDIGTSIGICRTVSCN